MARGGLRTQRTNTEAKPVSGPGSLSQRTDMDPIQPGQVPTSQVPVVPPVPVPSQGQPSGAGMSKITPLFAPTERPDEPVTEGMSVGPGSTPEPVQTGRFAITTQYLPELQRLAQIKETPQIFKTFVKYVEAVNRLDDINATGQ